MFIRSGIIVSIFLLSGIQGLSNITGVFRAGHKSAVGLQDSVDAFLLKSEEIIDTLPEIAAKYSSKAREIAHNLYMPEREALANKLLGESKLRLEEYYEARKHLIFASNYYENSNNKILLGKVKYLLGLNEYYLSNYTSAIDYYLFAYNIFSQNNMLPETANLLQNLGLVYHSVDEFEKAGKYYNKALQLINETGNNENIAGLYQNLGILNYNSGNDSLALIYYSKSAAHYKQKHDLKGLGITYSNLGLIELRKNKPHEAFEYFEESMQYFIKSGFRVGQMWAHNNMGTSLLVQKNYSLAETNFLKSLSIAREIGSTEGIMSNYAELSKFYEKQNQFNKSLQYFKLYTSIKDSVNTFNAKEKIKELEKIYLTESKESYKAGLIEKTKQQKEKIWAISGFLTILLLAVIVVVTAFYEKRNAERKLARHKTELEKLIEKRTKELQQQISERKTAEESDKLKSAFLANMSHELRTPMNAIIAFSNFLREPGLNEERRIEYLDHITTAGDSLLRLIDDIIDIAKIESKQLKLFIQPTNLNRLFSELYKVYGETRAKIIKKTIRFNLITDNEYYYIINTDGQRLKQVLSNLIENAFKYTDKGKIEIGFETTENSVTLFVSDTGIGIPADKHELIFDRFYQLNHLNDRKVCGTGLGLAISKNLVKLLGGQIWVDSEPGRGSTFTIRIPVDSLKKQPNPLYCESVKTGKTAQFRKYNWHNVTILVAEDEDLNYKVLDTCLTRTMAHIIRAKDGATAIEICKNQKVDLVLMDIQMPGIDGYEATQEIKRINNRTPVIAQTSFALIGEKERCLQAGCDDFITKPLNIDLLLQKIEHYINS
ncbi:MAG: tetratricopeptide repeat protein [Bacteroidales bacterium]|nr:tetratricopeptide repeat protein [Bacteroidales bacterium]